jgi:xanthine dehydrogenase accessory factor
MTDEVLRELVAARAQRLACALVTIAATRGSVPRAAGAKMLVFPDQRIVGTIGGGKFESLVIAEAHAALHAKAPVLKTYPLHESDAASFGAICGGEVTVFIEPQRITEALFLIGAGHCARALGRLARDCGWHVSVVDDRVELLAHFPADEQFTGNATAFIRDRTWRADEALVLVSRNYEIDREALDAALVRGGMGYLGMIGSRRKVRQVFADLAARGINEQQLAQVFAPVGLDVGADSPGEIAASIMAEMLQVFRGGTGGNLRTRESG